MTFEMAAFPSPLWVDVITTSLLKTRSTLKVMLGSTGLITFLTDLSSPSRSLLEVFEFTMKKYEEFFAKQRDLPLILWGQASDSKNLGQLKQLNVIIKLGPRTNKLRVFQSILDGYKNYIENVKTQADEELSALRTEVIPNKRVRNRNVFSIEFGFKGIGRRIELRPPIALLRETFYELGKMHGIRDIRTIKGQPAYGAVEVKCSPTYTLILYLSLLSCEIASGGEQNQHLFFTLHVEPGTKIDSDMASLLEQSYERIKYRLMKLFRYPGEVEQGMFMYFDYLHPYVLFQAYDFYLEYKNELTALMEKWAPLIGWRIHLLQKSGARFLRLSDIQIRLHELNVLDLVLSGIGFDEDTKRKIARSSYLALGSAIRLAVRTGERTYERIALDLRLLLQALMDGSYRYAVDVAYRLARTINETDIRSRLIGEIQSTAEDLEVGAVEKDIGMRLIEALNTLLENVVKVP